MRGLPLTFKELWSLIFSSASFVFQVSCPAGGWERSRYTIFQFTFPIIDIFAWRFLVQLEGSGRARCFCLLLPTFTQTLGVTWLLAVSHVPFSMLLHTVLVPEDWAVLPTSSLALWLLLGLARRGPGRSWGKNDAWSSPGSPQMDSVPTHRAQHPAFARSQHHSPNNPLRLGSGNGPQQPVRYCIALVVSPTPHKHL